MGGGGGPRGIGQYNMAVGIIVALILPLLCFLYEYPYQVYVCINY